MTDSTATATATRTATARARTLSDVRIHSLFMFNRGPKLPNGLPGNEILRILRRDPLVGGLASEGASLSRYALRIYHKRQNNSVTCELTLERFGPFRMAPEEHYSVIGVANCSPSDVFVEKRGVALSLRRALRTLRTQLEESDIGYRQPSLPHPTR